MADKIYNVLFLCTGNSSRSIMAEALLNAESKGIFKAYSAGSNPTGAVNRLALDLLHLEKIPTDGLTSKSWEEFAKPGAPEMDFIFTVCDQAANEPCPVWPGHPATAHWGFPDPAALEGSDAEKRAAFAEVFRMVRTRIGVFINLPLHSLDRLSLKKHIDDIATLT